MKEFTIGNTNIKVIYPKLTEEEEKRRLTHLYDACNELFKDKKECFYTSKEVEQLRKDKKNIFI